MTARRQTRPARRCAAVRCWQAGLAGLLTLGTTIAAAQAAAATDETGLQTRPAHARIGFERITLPGDERLGLVGTSYLVDVAPGSGFAVGPAVYGAISGQRGGFYTIGGEAAWRHRISGPFGVEAGLYVGGGGGSAAPQGGGLMLRPHADLWWQFGSQRAGVSLSRVRFPNGRIDSTQLGLVWNVASDFGYAPGDRIGAPLATTGRSGLGFDRVQAVVGSYRPRAGATRLDGQPLTAAIGTVGVRAEQAWGRHTYWGLESNGAASGGIAGYAEYLATVGAETPVWDDRLILGGRVALGMGGGGGVSVGGGLLTKAALYATLQLTPEFAVSLERGVAQAPQGSFKAVQTAVALRWTLDGPGGNPAPAPSTRTEFGAGIESYDAARRDGTTRSLQADVLKINRFISANAYLSGQVHSAIAGGAGGYSAGYFGVGWQQPFGPHWHAAAELLAGAAGGGGVDTSGGGLLQTMGYIGYQLSPSLALRLGAGHIKARHGRLGSNVVDLSLAFTYGVPLPPRR